MKLWILFFLIFVLLLVSCTNNNSNVIQVKTNIANMGKNLQDGNIDDYLSCYSDNLITSGHLKENIKDIIQKSNSIRIEITDISTLIRIYPSEAASIESAHKQRMIISWKKGVKLDNIDEKKEITMVWKKYKNDWEISQIGPVDESKTTAKIYNQPVPDLHKMLK